MEVQVAVEAERIVGSVVGGRVNGGLFEASVALGFGFWIKRDAFKRCCTMVAIEAFGVETGLRRGVAGSTRCDDATGDR